jgi:hypothetical protein
MGLCRRTEALEEVMEGVRSRMREGCRSTQRGDSDRRWRKFILRPVKKGLEMAWSSWGRGKRLNLETAEE